MFGYLSDLEDPLQLGEQGRRRDRRLDDHPESPIAGLNKLPSEASLAHLWESDIYQLSEPSCVGHAVPAGLFLAKRARGMITAPMPCRMWCWNMSRHMHQPSYEPLAVTGTYIRRAISVLQKHGYPNDTDWPYDPHAPEYWQNRRIERRQARPPLNVVRRAFHQRGPRGYYLSTSFEQNLLANAAALPVVFGILVDDEFTDVNGPSVVDKIVPTIGMGHAMLQIGYKRIDGKLYAECLNWWHGWRTSIFYISEEIMSTQTYDNWVIDP